MAFLPAARNAWERRATASLVLMMGLLVSVAAGSCLMGLLSGLPWLLVKDAAVQPHMATIALPVGGGPYGGTVNTMLIHTSPASRPQPIKLLAAKQFCISCRPFCAILDSTACSYFIQAQPLCQGLRTFVCDTARLLFTVLPWTRAPAQAMLSMSLTGLDVSANACNLASKVSAAHGWCHKKDIVG